MSRQYSLGHTSWAVSEKDIKATIDPSASVYAARQSGSTPSKASKPAPYIPFTHDVPISSKPSTKVYEDDTSSMYSTASTLTAEKLEQQSKPSAKGLKGLKQVIKGLGEKR